jgi:hypothetical protein
MVVGPPGDGKTEIVNSTLMVPGVQALHKVKGDASFLSATSKKEVSKDATGGVFRLIGWHGAILFDDFTSVLSLQKKEMEEVLDVFRQSYGGTWSRDVGTDGGRRLSWGPGKVGFLGGVTSVIDANADVTSAMGERFLYYRTNGYGVSKEVVEGTAVESYEKTRRALLNDEGHAHGGVEGWQEDMRGLVAGYFEGLGLKFGVMDRWYEKAKPERELSDRELARIIKIAEVASRARSSVLRDSFTREIMGLSENERSTRISKALRQLYVGMEAIGVEEDREDGSGRWAVLEKVAMDCMPGLRRLVVEMCWRKKLLKERGEGDGIEVVGAKEVQIRARTSKQAVLRAIEDLEVHGCVGVEVISGAKFCALSERMWSDMRKGWAI